jgi:hypothetical protein
MRNPICMNDGSLSPGGRASEHGALSETVQNTFVCPLTAAYSVPTEPNHLQAWTPGVQNKTPQTLFESWDVC